MDMKNLSGRLPRIPDGLFIQFLQLFPGLFRRLFESPVLLLCSPGRLRGEGRCLWSFIQENLIDELSLVIAPVADGSRESASVFEKADFLPYRDPAAFVLKAAEKIDGDTLWLRYLLKE